MQDWKQFINQPIILHQNVNVHLDYNPVIDIIILKGINKEICSIVVYRNGRLIDTINYLPIDCLDKPYELNIDAAELLEQYIAYRNFNLNAALKER